MKMDHPLLPAVRLISTTQTGWCRLKLSLEQQKFLPCGSGTCVNRPLLSISYRNFPAVIAFPITEFSGAHQNFPNRNFQKPHRRGSNLHSSDLNSNTLSLRHIYLVHPWASGLAILVLKKRRARKLPMCTGMCWLTNLIRNCWPSG
jgi:hypothetical protein